jgi:lipopolysaccharide/colanic/teichoic acid biosynthesis glycosyltransferase
MPLFSSSGPDGPRGYRPAAVSRKRHVRELFNPDQMHAVLRRERARADRQQRQFALVLFHLDIGAENERELVRLATVLLKQVRETDEVGRFDRTTLCAILPDTDSVGASMLIARVRRATRGRKYEPTCTVYTYPDNTLGKTSSRITSSQSGNDSSMGGTPVTGADTMLGGASADSSMNGDAQPLSGDKRNGDGQHISGEGNHHAARFTGVEVMPASRDADAKPACEINSQVELVPARPMGELFAEPLPMWKRAIDLCVSSVAIVLTSPIMITAAIGIRLTSKGPALFLQQRTGLGGKPFTIYKFRTMRTDAEAMKDSLRKLSHQDGPAFKIENDPRITGLGHFLRKTSIDELPQLFNIFKGDMTLVGPRPLPVKEANGCEPWQYRRHDVTPGLTCIWQVEGRSRVKFDDWMRMDMRYARKRTLISDIMLVLRTAPAVLLRRGAQ